MQMKMKIFEAMAQEGHEQVFFNYDRTTGLKAVIAIHDTTLGPAQGGCRMWNYEDEDQVVTDALRLSKGMTDKCAAAELDYGGGKSVIWGDPKKDKSEALFRAFARYIEALKGRYKTGTDVGTTYDDFIIALKETKHVGALPEEYGGGGNSGLITAYGVWMAIRAVAKELFADDSLTGRTVAVQGLGKVGHPLVGHLLESGAKVIASDINPESRERARRDYDLQIVPPEEILTVECDILSPCALGAVLNDDTIPRLRCQGIAGAANNQLAEPRHGQLLHQRGILFAPDFVANAGGLIQVCDELEGYNKNRAFRKTAMIYDRLLAIFARAKEEGITPYEAANRLVAARIETIGRIKRSYTGR
jgi:leucine dehydrogenase